MRVRRWVGSTLLAVAAAGLVAGCAARNERVVDLYTSVVYEKPEIREVSHTLTDTRREGGVAIVRVSIVGDPGLTASGNFRIEMEVFLFDPGQRREAFGMFFGGSDLEGANQAYTYFLIRNGGESIIKERAGSETPTVQPWTPGEGILSYADRGDDASVKNVLAVECGSETVRFFVNGDEVGSVARSEIPTDGPGPTIANAISDALGIRFRSLPITPEDVRKAWLEKQARELAGVSS